MGTPSQALAEHGSASCCWQKAVLDQERDRAPQHGVPTLCLPVPPQGKTSGTNLSPPPAEEASKVAVLPVAAPAPRRLPVRPPPLPPPRFSLHSTGIQEPARTFGTVREARQDWREGSRLVPKELAPSVPLQAPVPPERDPRAVIAAFRVRRMEGEDGALMNQQASGCAAAGSRLCCSALHITRRA